MVALPEQSPGQTTIDDIIDIEPVNEGETPDESAYYNEDPPSPQRQVLILPGQYAVNEEVLLSSGGEFAELGFGTPVYGGQLYFTRSQCLEIGSALIQIAGKMIPPKVLKQMAEEREAQASAAKDLVVVERDTSLVDPAGKPLTTKDMRV